MKKSIISAALAILLLFGFTGCAKNAAENELYPGDGNAGGGKYYYNAEEAGNATYSDASDATEDLVVFVENDFIKAENAPISTFSADVDTASYTYFRKLVQNGYSLSELTATAGYSIRTEEMINYFSYSYNQPADGELFGVKARISPCPWNSESVLMVLGLQTAVLESKTDNNLVFLIDVSGSMSSEDKLPLLKKAFSYLTAQLDANDTVSIVTYSGKEEVVLEGCSGSKTDMIMKAVNGLKASGSTNGESGLKKAYEIAEKYYKSEGNNRIIMASDGDLNVGISSASELKEYISGKCNSGVYLSVLGFGTGNYRDANMEALADNGNGVYYYIDNETEAEKVFGSDLISTLYTVAEDVKLQLTFNPICVSEYRLIGYENRLLSKEDFEDDTKDAGEVGAGHSVTVCYELKLTSDARESDGEWMKLAVRYKNPGEDKSNLNEYVINRSDYTDTPDSDYTFVCAVTELSMILHNSKYIGNITIDTVISTLNDLDLSSDTLKTQFRDLVRTLAGK